MTQQDDITQPVLTDADLLRICQQFNPGQDLDLAKAVRDALLSKLRAPVADERALIEKLEAWQAVCDRIVDQYGGVVAGVDFAALGRANRAALASAPVAGEAQPVAWLHQCRKKPELTQITMKKHEPALAAKGFRPVPLYAAPQASAEDDRELRAAAQAFYDASKTVARFAVESLDDRDALVAASVRLRAALSATQPEQGERDEG